MRTRIHLVALAFSALAVVSTAAAWYFRYGPGCSDCGRRLDQKEVLAHIQRAKVDLPPESNRRLASLMTLGKKERFTDEDWTVVIAAAASDDAPPAEQFAIALASDRARRGLGPECEPCLNELKGVILKRATDPEPMNRATVLSAMEAFDWLHDPDVRPLAESLMNEEHFHIAVVAQRIRELGRW